MSSKTNFRFKRSIVAIGAAAVMAGSVALPAAAA